MTTTTATTRRRWFQFGMRALFVVVTLSGVILGSRIEYLRRWALFYEGEAHRHIETIQSMTGLSPEEAVRFAELEAYQHAGWQVLGNGWAVSRDEIRAAVHHRRQAERFRQSTYRPWTLVDQTPPP